MEFALALLISGAGAAFAAVKFGEAKRNRALEHPVRQAIVSHLKANNCASISDLCRALNLSWGVMQHHLYVLSKADIIFGSRNGRSHIFFPREEKSARAAILALLQSVRAREIVDEVAKQPGVRQKDLCDRLGLSRKVFRHHINLLSQAGLIVETRRDTARIYEPSERFRSEFPIESSDAPPVPVPEAPRPPAEPSSVSL